MDILVATFVKHDKQHKLWWRWQYLQTLGGVISFALSYDRHSLIWAFSSVLSCSVLFSYVADYANRHRHQNLLPDITIIFVLIIVSLMIGVLMMEEERGYFQSLDVCAATIKMTIAIDIAIMFINFITSLHRFIITASAVLRHDSPWTIEFVDIWVNSRYSGSGDFPGSWMFWVWSSC